MKNQIYKEENTIIHLSTTDVSLIIDIPKNDHLQ